MNHSLDTVHGEVVRVGAREDFVEGSTTADGVILPEEVSRRRGSIGGSFDISIHELLPRSAWTSASPDVDSGGVHFVVEGVEDGDPEPSHGVDSLHVISEVRTVRCVFFPSFPPFSSFPRHEQERVDHLV